MWKNMSKIFPVFVSHFEFLAAILDFEQMSNSLLSIPKVSEYYFRQHLYRNFARKRLYMHITKSYDSAKIAISAILKMTSLCQKHQDAGLAVGTLTLWSVDHGKQYPA